MLKKIFIFLILVVLTTTGVSCGGGGQQNQPEVTLTIWQLFDSEEVFEPIIRDFQIEYRNVKINYIKKDYKEYEEKSVDALAAGEGPDIWMIRNDWIYKHRKKLVPMPEGLMAEGIQGSQGKSNLEMYKNMFASVVSENNIIDNQIYGMPFSCDTLALFYNTRMFTEERVKLEDERKVSSNDKILRDPPNTWEDIIEYSKILTKKEGSKIIRGGIAMGTATNVVQATDIVYALMLQNGTKMVSDDKKSAAFNLPQTKTTGEPVYPGTQALEFYTSFANPNKENYSWNSSMPDSYTAFKEGKLAMMIDYAYQARRLKQEMPTLNFAIAPLPQIKGVSIPIDYATYWTETVTKNSKNPTWAWRFIKFAATRGLNNYLSATKLPSPYKTDESLIPQVAERADSRRDPFLFQVTSAKTWFKGNYPIKVDQAIFDMINNVATYNQPPQTSIDAAATKVTELLQED